MCKISIIIPVYNSEKYLRECLDSVLAQTYSDFEVLLIDDGSTDASGKICEEYAFKDARFKVFHKRNGGVSAARNLGLDYAKGEWIAFVDSDDKVLENYLVDLVKYIDEETDLIIQGFQKIKKNTIKYDIGINNITVVDFHKLFEEIKIIDFGYPFSKFYRRSIIKSYNITFPTQTSQAEDLLFLLSFLPYSRTVKAIPIHNYLYIANENSLVHTFQKPEVYFYQYYLLKILLKNKYKDVYSGIYDSSREDYSYTQSIQFSTLLKFIKGIYYYHKDDKVRLSLLKETESDDKVLLKKCIKNINNPILIAGYNLLIRNKYVIADKILFTYYKIVNIILHRNGNKFINIRK
ncbi:glycosyltransferase family 2 protein [Weeksellaceae bacterium A-14]